MRTAQELLAYARANGYPDPYIGADGVVHTRNPSNGTPIKIVENNDGTIFTALESVQWDPTTPSYMPGTESPSPGGFGAFWDALESRLAQVPKAFSDFGSGIGQGIGGVIGGIAEGAGAGAGGLVRNALGVPAWLIIGAVLLVLFLLLRQGGGIGLKVGL